MLTTAREALALAAALTALPVTAGVSYVTFVSAALEFEVRVGYSIDDGELYADPQLLEIWIGCADVTLHLCDAAINSLAGELCDAVREQDDRAQDLAQEDRAVARAELELVL